MGDPGREGKERVSSSMEGAYSGVSRQRRLTMATTMAGEGQKTRRGMPSSAAVARVQPRKKSEMMAAGGEEVERAQLRRGR